jgi:hypothetical protein
MPTLPAAPEVPEGPIERVSGAIRRAGAAIGVDTRVPFRVMVLFATSVVCLSLAPTPWAQVGLVATFGLALDWIRMRSRPGS